MQRSKASLITLLKKIPVLFVVLIATNAVMADASAPAKTLITVGTWYRWLDTPQPAHANSHYRMELYSFYSVDGDNKATIKCVNALIYPTAEVRTLLRIGTVQDDGDQSSAPGKITVTQEYSALALNTGKPDGFPVATQFAVSGLRRDPAQMYFTIAPGRSKDTIMINSKEFRSYRGDLIRLSQGQQSVDAAADLLRLLFVHIYLIQARVPQFGSSAMLYIKQSYPALISGSVDLEFEPKGLFGTGNSGILFRVLEASEFPQITVKGEIFAGAYQMEGSLSFYLQNGDKSLFIASFDAGQVGVKNGITNSGVYAISFPPGSDAPKTFEVPHNVLGQ